MLEYAPYLALSILTLWSLHHTRLACFIGNHNPGNETMDNDGPNLAIVRHCTRCHHETQREILTPQWSSEVGTLYGKR